MYCVPSWGTLCMLLSRSWPFIWCIRAEWSFTGFWSILIPIFGIHGPWIGVRWFMGKHQSDHTESWSDPHIGHKLINDHGRIMTAGLLMIWNFGHSKQWNICVACLNHSGIQEWQPNHMQARTVLQAKIEKVKHMGHCRPITMLGQIYGLISKIVAIRFFCGGHTFYQICFFWRIAGLWVKEFNDCSSKSFGKNIAWKKSKRRIRFGPSKSL